LSLLAACSLALAQDPQDNPPPAESQQSSPNHGWRRATDPPPVESNRDYSPDPGNLQSREPEPNASNYGAPPQLTIRRGTYVTVRVNGWLSSDRNHPGDAFSATLVRPVVVDGVVVAQPGQTVGGRVAEAQKAGRVEGVSRLGLQLTELTLADGQRVPIQCGLISRSGPTSVGRDAGAIAGTTAVGAAAGAAADWGRGAAIGAGAGAVVGVVGVLLTRGQPTVIYPESVLTFRIDQPVAISTDRAPQAFRYVEPDDYERPQYAEDRPPQGRNYPPPPAYYAPGYYYGPGYYPYYYGPGLGFYGPSFYFGRGFYGRGYYGRGFYGRGFSGGRGYSRGGGGRR
jgi:hypothetical protein